MLEQDFCESTDTVHVYIQPTAPIADFSADPPQGCAPLTVQFTNLTKYGDPSMYRWHFGDGEGVSKAEHPSHTYYEPGIYSVKLEATNESGITDAAVKRFLIEVFPVPHADFSVRPETVKLPDDPIYTTNLSFDADTYFWDFGDGGTSTEYEPSHSYTELGKYDIMLIAQTEKGCADTAIYESIVGVIEGNEIRIPNAFTPSLDGPSDGNRFNSGRNDVFFPVTEGVIGFHMQIYNRWGELLFDTADNSKGWDGYYKGRICPPDVYIYKIDFKFIDGREVMKFGDIALIR
jgi:gliding motility-associated-like protein